MDIILKQKLLKIKNLENTIFEALNNLEEPKIAIVGHQNPKPDSDCINSSIALGLLLKAVDKNNNIEILFREELNTYSKNVLNYSESVIHKDEYDIMDLVKFGVPEYYISDAKLIFVLDTDFERTGFKNSNFPKAKSVIVIDHHRYRRDWEGDFPRDIYKEFVFESKEKGGAQSTSELILLLLSEIMKGINNIRRINMYEMADVENEDDLEELKNYMISQRIYHNCTGSEIQNLYYDIYKLCMGGIHTDSGSFTYNGCERTIETISIFLNRFQESGLYIDSSYLSIPQDKIEEITYSFKEDEHTVPYLNVIKNMKQLKHL